MKLFKSYQNLINPQSYFRNERFTDSGLIKFGKSLITLPKLVSLSLNFGW